MKKRILSALVAVFTAACGVGVESPEGALAEDDVTQSEQALVGPTTLSYTGPGDLIASTGNLYWTAYSYDEFAPSTTATVYRASKSNVPGQERVLWRETGNTNVYRYFGALCYANVGGAFFGYFVANYGTTSQIKRVPLEGGTAIVLANAPAFIGTRDLVTDGLTLFWADAQGIRSMPVGGGAIRTLVSGTTFSNVALNSTQLYFTDGMAIRHIPKGGGAMVTDMNDTYNITALKVYESGSTTVYWGTAGGTVRSRRSGGSVVTYQNPIVGRRVSSVDFDGSRVLWTDCTYPNGNGCNVKRRQGTSTSTLATGGVGVGNLQSDATSMYWGEASSLKKIVH